MPPAAAGEEAAVCANLGYGGEINKTLQPRAVGPFGGRSVVFRLWCFLTLIAGSKGAEFMAEARAACL